ncbi:DUF6717 family protein [Chloroflexota bacterium]
MTFSAQPFPGFQRELIWVREEYEGNWYRLAGSQDEGWLCPAMFHYFQQEPENLYAKRHPVARRRSRLGIKL